MHKKIPNIFTFISKFKKNEVLNLNKEVGIIFRDYEKKYNKYKIIEARDFCKQNKRKFYLANDIKLAINLNLDGAYITSFNKNLWIQKYNIKKKFLILGSAHNILEMRIKEKQRAKLIFVSPLFQTKDYKKKLGVIKFNILSRLCKEKIIALGGINKKNINKLKMTNAYGFSGISYFQNKFYK